MTKIDKQKAREAVRAFDDGQLSALVVAGLLPAALDRIDELESTVLLYKHVTEQVWVPEIVEDGVYLVAANDRTTIIKLCRPDRDSDLLMAGYIMGLQARQLRKDEP